MFGCYEALTAGKARDAMVDMTGGVGEGLDVADFPTGEKRDKLFNIIHKANAKMSLMAASIQVCSLGFILIDIHTIISGLK